MLDTNYMNKGNLKEQMMYLSHWIYRLHKPMPSRFGKTFVTTQAIMHEGREKWKSSYEILSANKVKLDCSEYIVLSCSTAPIAEYGGQEHIGMKLDCITDVYICIKGKHSANGRALLQQIEDSIGKGFLDDTNKYIGESFVIHSIKRDMNSWEYNQIGMVYPRVK